MLEAYVDDSKSEQDPPFFVLGGYVAPVETWARFSDEWDKALRMSPRIRYFKYREALRGEGEFNGVSEESRLFKTKIMRGIIERFDLIEFGIGFRVVDHNDAFKLLRPDPNPNYYNFAFSRVIPLIVHGLLAHSNQDDRLNVIFDKQDMEKAKVLEAWETAIKLAGIKDPIPMVENFLKSTPRWEDDKEVLPLQAADMHATWLRIDAENQFQGRPREAVPGFSKELRGMSKVYSRGDLMNEFWQSRQVAIRLRQEGKL